MNQDGGEGYEKNDFIYETIAENLRNECDILLGAFPLLTKVQDYLTQLRSFWDATAALLMGFKQRAETSKDLGLFTAYTWDGDLFQLDYTNNQFISFSRCITTTDTAPLNVED